MARRIPTIEVPVAADIPPGNITETDWLETKSDVIAAKTEVDVLSALRFDPSHPNYGATRDTGLSPAQRNANSAAIQLAADDARIAGGTLVIKGAYECGSGVQLRCHVDGRGGRLYFYDQAIDPAVLVGDASTRLQAYSIVLPEIYQGGKVTTGWGNDTGLRFTNVYTSEITIPRVTNFRIGVDFNADGPHGTVYNNVYLGLIHNNMVGLDFTATDGGWVNECVFFGGQMAINSSEGTNITHARHIRMGTAASGNGFNNHIFIKPSIEGNGPEYHLEYGGQYNTILQGRWEAAPPKILGLTGSNSLVVEGGYNAQSITVTGPIFDLRIMSRLREKWASSGNVHGLMVMANLSSENHPAITIMQAGSPENFWSANPETDYSWSWGQKSLRGKGPTDAFPRIQLNAHDGRIYMGNGTVSPTLMMRTGGSGSTFGPYLDGAKVYTAGPIAPKSAGPEVHAGTGNPEGVQAAPAGSIFLSTSGTIYRKSSGTGNTGWVAMS